MATDMAQPKLQAGGGEASAIKRLDHVTSIVLTYLKAYAEGRRALGDEQLREIPQLEQGSAAAGAGTLDMKALLDYMTSEKANAMLPAPTLELDHPISSYFVSSSHNSYLQGNQLWGEASSEVYDNILRRGCRCVEIDVWNGQERDDRSGESPAAKRGLKAYLSKKLDKFRKDSPDRGRRQGDRTPNDKAHSEEATAELRPPAPWRSPSTMSRAEPRVLHGFTLTKEVSFREVCQAIGDAAFTTSDLPVIVSLEVHADSEQQDMMVDIMQEVWRDKLVEPLSENCTSLPNLADLKHKILIKVKAAPHSDPRSTTKQPQESIDDSSSVSDEESGASQSHHSGQKKKKKAITEALSRMGVYTRGYHFKDFSHPDAEIPTHVFSLSEKKLVDVHEEHGPQLLAHNRRFLMRAYPSGSRLASTNFDPSTYWRMGVQIVALNWQKFDAGVMLNEGQFANTGGWVLKPPNYRPQGAHGSASLKPDAGDPSSHADVDLAIEILAAQDLPGVVLDSLKQEELRPYVKCMLHIERTRLQDYQHVEKGKKNKEKLKWRSRTASGTNPDFRGETAHFRNTKATEELSFVRFKIQNDVPGRDTLIAWACIRLDRLKPGLRFIHLLDSHGVGCSAAMLVHVVKHKKA